MSRLIKVAAAQVGAIDSDAPIEGVVARLTALLEQAHEQGVELINFPELALSTFFARHIIPFGPELDKYFIKGDILEFGPLKEFFALAKKYKIAISIGFAELTESGDHYNTNVTIGKDGKFLHKYRKTHIPGDAEPVDFIETQHLEKRYFLPSDLGFEAFRFPGTDSAYTEERGEPILGVLICNDRRWPEAWRCYGLQGVEIMLVGYNTPSKSSGLDGVNLSSAEFEAHEQKAIRHHNLCMQYNSYANCTYSIGAARCGRDDGNQKYEMFGSSSIVSPWGDIIASANTKDDELVVAEIDLDKCAGTRTRIFDFKRHRHPEQYGRIISQVGVIEPPRLHAAKE